MELSSSVHEDSRYITRSGHKQHKSQARGDAPGYDRFEAVQDARQDVPHESEQRTWNDVADQVHNLFCQAPCFVNTSSSLDASDPPPDNRRMDPPASPVKDFDAMLLSDSSLHARDPPAPPIRFPSVHLDSGDWESGEEDNSAFFQTANGVPSIGTRIASRLQQAHESIYRNQSTTSAGRQNAPASLPSCSQTTATNNCNSSQASTIATIATTKYGLYRSPAWSHGDAEEESDLVSIAGDDDWLDISPELEYNSRTPTPYYEHSSHCAVYSDHRGNDDSKTVIDVTDMDDMFNDFTLGNEGYGSERRR